MPQTNLNQKEEQLRAIIREIGSCIVAYSGGVDSALVLAIANEELGKHAIGITADSPSLARRDYNTALETARAVGASVVAVPTDEMQNSNYSSNPPNRCYFCKTALYKKLADIAKERGAAWVVDGFNKDDENDIRPGRKAARDFGVRSPLYEAAMCKDDVRALARHLNIPVWDKPANACTASRFPTGTAITVDLLRQVEAAEDAVLRCGIATCRVRHHGDLARIEVEPDDMQALLDRGSRELIIAGVRAAGYRYVTLDLAGYVQGNLRTSPYPARDADSRDAALLQ